MFKKPTVILFLLHTAQSICAQSAFEKVTDRYRQWFLAHNTVKSDSIKDGRTGLAKGVWADIDYTNQYTASWKTPEHLSRVRSMASAWSDTGSVWYQDKALYNSIGLAVNHWLQKKYVNPNWWYNEIGVPQYWRDILILIGNKLPADRRTEALALLQKYNVKPNFTGANLVWSADLLLHDGLLTQNENKVKMAVALIAREIKVSDKEGIRQDYSFQQHGRRLQTHSYGGAFVENNIRISWELHNSPWPIPESRIDTLVDFLLNGWQWMSRGICNSPATVDRAVSRPGNLHNSDLRDLLPYLIGISRNKTDSLEAMLSVQNGLSQTIKGFRYFPCSEFAAYQQKEYSCFLKMVSTRTEFTEAINQENLKGNLLNLGDTWLIRNGQEYTDLMPLMDWKKLPGQTVAADATIIERQAFAGGISDGVSGLAAMDIKMSGRGSLSVCKLWAFDEGKIICLIAGLDPGNGKEVYTTLNQCRWRGDVTVDNTSNKIKAGVHHLKRVNWLHHDGFVYIPAGGHALNISLENRTGTWNSISASGSSAAITGKVFMPVMHHASDTSAAYTVAAAATPLMAAALAKETDITILKNSRFCQAVIIKGKKIMAAFRQPVSEYRLTENTIVSASAPCLLIIDGNTIHVSDPLEKGEKLQVSINRR